MPRKHIIGPIPRTNLIIGASLIILQTCLFKQVSPSLYMIILMQAKKGSHKLSVVFATNLKLEFADISTECLSHHLGKSKESVNLTNIYSHAQPRHTSLEVNGSKFGKNSVVLLMPICFHIVFTKFMFECKILQYCITCMRNLGILLPSALA